MRSFTRPPNNTKNFRQKKYEEGLSKEQYPDTLAFSSTPYSNVGATYEQAHSFEIPPKFISGKGDSIRCRYVGVTAASVNTKAVEIRYGGATLFNARVDDGTGVAFLWTVEVELFGSAVNNQEQIIVAKVFSSQASFTTSEIYGGVFITTEDANSPQSIEIYVAGSLAGEITFKLAKLEFSPAP